MKNISNILLGLACMVGIPVSAHFIVGSAEVPYALVASSEKTIDSILPFADADFNKSSGRIYFTASAGVEVNEVSSFRDFMKVNVPSKAALGTSKEGRKIQAYFFPGTSDKTALIIGGVHGSELSSIDVAHEVIMQLSTGLKLHYNVIVVPCLFPDNANDAESRPVEIGSPANIGRYSSITSVDPNRQMPPLGKAPDFEKQSDHLGRRIEKENLVLMELISEYKPDRIVNIHAIRNEASAGIYADPRTDATGAALGFATDSSLAIDMAKYVYNNGGTIRGNRIEVKPSAVYLKDPNIVPAGKIQPRNLCGAKLPHNRGAGVSLGGWASTAVCDHQHPQYNRPAIRLLTMEFPGYRPPRYIDDAEKKAKCQKNVNLYAAAITQVFLQDYYVEEKVEPCIKAATKP